MLEIYLIVLSIFFIGLSIRFFHSLHSHKKYVKSLYGIIQNFILVFCIIFLINLLSVAIINNITERSISQIDIPGVASYIENHDINRIAEK
ncbi:MAG: hypothetical protein FWE18_02300 [Alphaproteobacteria bacterium]|nr:hypothetical protein [Alphaproteobacteria bacterium]